MILSRRCIVGLMVGLPALAQEPAVDRIVVPFRDAARPRWLKISLLNGGIKVRGYDGKDVIVEARTRSESSSRSGRRGEPGGRSAEGMRRLENTSVGLTAEEEDNVVSVGVRSFNRTVDLDLQVPFATNLRLHNTNSGSILVERITGEVDVNSTNGAVTLSNITGSVVAHALNHDVVVTFDKITPDKAMSFSSLNGDIDVTLPPDIKANVKMKSDQGDIYSDFEIRMDAPRPVVEEGKEKGGKYRVRIERMMTGTINGGGPEIQLTTFNGKIYIRKKK